MKALALALAVALGTFFGVQLLAEVLTPAAFMNLTIIGLLGLMVWILYGAFLMEDSSKPKQ